MTTGDYSANHLAYRLRAASVGREEKLFAEVDGRRVTYGELFAGAERIAAALTDAGVAPGDRVVAQVEKSIAAVQLYLAAVIAGGVFVPLNPAYTVAEAADRIQDAEPTVLVCDPNNTDALGAQFSLAADGGGTLTTAAATDTVDATAATGTVAVVTADATDPAALLYTSGTTGRAKGAVLSHANLAVNARALADRWRFTADDVLLHALPLFHTHGLFVAVNVALVAGASLIFLPRFDTAAVINAMPRATVLMGVPTFYSRLLAAGVGKKDAAAMRVFISGSAPLPAAVFDEWRARTGHAIVERYGLTETGINTSNRCDDGRAGTVGLPLAGVEVRVTDDGGDVLPAGEVGAVEVRGQNVFQGYWRRREQTAAAFRDGFFITGDLGCIDAHGYLTIAGRADDLIISGGNNIHPHEVESAINGVAGVRECAVVGVPDTDLGEVAAAVVVTDADTVTDADIAAALKTKLARYKHPKKIIRTNQLPRNAMGKVQKNVLRERYGASG